MTRRRRTIGPGPRGIARAVRGFLVFLALAGPALVSRAAAAGPPTADELRARLEHASGSARVDLLNEISKSRWGVSSDETLSWADQAIALARKIGYPAGEASGLRNKAIGFWYRDDYPSALDFSLRAREIYDRIGDRKGSVACRSTIGTIYLNLDRFDEALATYRAALPLAEEIGDENRVGILLLNIATTLLGKKQPAEALAYAERALPILRKDGSQLDVLTALGNIGGALKRLGRYAEALEINRQILDLAARADSRVRLVDAMTDTGEILDAMGRHAEAFSWVQKAIERAEKEQLKRNLADAELVMVGLCERQGDYRGALAHQKRYAEVRNAVITDENTKAMAALQVQYDTEKKERQIQTQKLEIQRQASTRDLLVAGSLLALVLLVATYGRYRAKRRENALLESLSRTDPLTGLANRRALREALEREALRTRREGSALSLVLADVDHFKAFNDRHGHDTGDAVLAGVARAFRSAVREIDLVAR
ncbi:MAG TPA: tetratricopeptide repeat-containing diguanylate cyclase, partial [Thermoanaerobaculia bacterium]|nr:tetratricopeptide repeat-containing diguanylate cyclase [Thermoanaerobaculia bacterium]